MASTRSHPDRSAALRPQALRRRRDVKDGCCQRVTGVRYHPAWVWYILRRELGWSWQRRARRASERNDEAIQQWVKKRWPQLKVRATWAPRGHTPVPRHPFNWKRLSLAGALAFEPDGGDAHLVFELRPGAYNDETLIEFLTMLKDIEQRRVLMVWDGLLSHRSKRMRDCIASQRDWLSVEACQATHPTSIRWSQPGAT
jgi:Winged helix-turn helix